MAKRTTRKSSSTPVAVSAPAAHAEVPVEQTVKTVERETSGRGRQEEVRASLNLASVTHDMIAQRAYEIWRTQGGNDLENWVKAERELRTRDTQQGQWH